MIKASSEELMIEIENLNRWVEDLLSGMYVNCVYCGHRYGPDSSTPVSMADVLKDHIKICPKHPMSKLLQALRSIQQKAEVGANNVKLMPRETSVQIFTEIMHDAEIAQRL